MSDELIELPEGWEQVKLGEIIELKYGKGLVKTVRDGGKYAVYGSNGVVGAHSQFLIEKPCLVVGRKGSIGEVHLSEKPCWAIDTTYYIDDLHNQPINFWFYRLKALSLEELNRASAIPGLNREDAYSLSILLPPLNEQKRIVAEIEALRERSQKARSALSAIPELCDKFRQSVLAAAFRGDLTADWREQNPDVEPASVLLERIKGKRFKLANTRRDILSIQKVYEQEANNPPNTSELLPLTWMKCTVSSIGNVCNGSTPSRKESEYWEGSIPWVSSGEVCNNEIFETREKITKDGYSSSSVRLLPQGTVLIAMIGEGKTRGQTAILRIDATINQNIAGVALNHGLVVSEYLWYWFQSILRTKFGQVLSLKP